MERTLARFARSLEGDDVGLVFYAGHGLQVEGINYLVPVDATLEHRADLPFEAVPLDIILGQLERNVPVSLVFLDACRDNPLARTLARSMGSTRSSAIGRGLAEVNGGIGSLIAYSTQPDNVALDGEGDHSPFTSALLEHIATPGLEVRQILTRVRSEVIAETRGRQVPWDHSSLTRDFYFAPEAEPDPPPPAALPADPVPAPPAGNGQAELLFWQTVKDSTDAADFEAYLSAFG